MNKFYFTISVSIICLLFTNMGSSQTYNIIINEFSQGPSGTTGDWIELVVTADGTDIRGVYYDDDNTPATGFLGKEYSVQLSKTLATFQSAGMGSTILIYRTPRDPRILEWFGTDDTDFSDGKIVIPETNTTFLEDSGNGLLLQKDRDEFGIFWDNGDTSVVVGIHGVAWGGETGSASLYSSEWGYTQLDSVGAGESARFNEGTPGEVSTAVNWTIEAYNLATPGTLNGGNNNALPVELTSFSAIIKENEIILNWRTETEVNNYGFEVERNLEGDSWQKLGFVEGNGNTNSVHEYSFVDNNISLTGKYSYRLKQIDNDGKYEFSKSIYVDLNAPANFDLKQNYPNPFNPSTTISFNLPENEFVTLKVFNAIGEEVLTLFEGNLEAGVHTYNFNASDFPSGLYIYNLTANNKKQTRKMLLLK
jgi:hypothetical protein